ncbi:hypothetical protein [Microbacterium sp.]|uniref:hypothetical protein n=1 Tax=Microbacterium sp. TaxID=51671 RepID=UPI0028125538|nr:hypothetical protein [Microbacterium sp.]
MTTLRRWTAAAKHRARGLITDERGDVPGWVLVTLMTAALVVVIWAVAGPALVDLFEQAISRVSGI